MLSLKGKRPAESQGPAALGEVIARKALKEGGGFREASGERTKISLT
jgi:hypothetical protein